MLFRSIAVDAENRIWVTDAENNFALRFTIPEDTVEPEAEIIDIPALPAGLTFNAESGLVYNELNMPVYRLSTDGIEWIPVVPDSIADLLQEGAEPQKDGQGGWILLSEENVEIFRWDPLTFAWIATSTTP